jgi:hypothetical protein
MHADFIANLPIGARWPAVDGPADKERPCRPSPPEMVNWHGPFPYCVVLSLPRVRTVVSRCEPTSPEAFLTPAHFVAFR